MLNLLKNVFLFKKRMGGCDLVTLLTGEMSKSKKVFRDITVISDRYEILFDSAEFKEHKPFLPSLEKELSTLLIGLASSQKYSFLRSPPQVTIADGGRLGEKALIKSSCSRPVVEELEEVVEHDPLFTQKPAKSCVAFHIISEKQPEPIELGTGTYIIGRGAEADVQIGQEDHLVSRKHCQLTIDESCATIEDLASGNGTLINQHRIIGVYVLNNGDVLQLGASKIEVCL
ncbi:FhaA domain-containing protein [Desulfotalea psychrophila]|uniref:FHA domain-containing protein n=1 Tax=Desulfotalea psychrophila (strain LSv54 / DSM 12343) TaxID=177439 RepID=Q6AKH0_DESPS|nr:FhaA domain-containing protein [Desulfotalea psychrophila]CAG37155.1 hypothetical protein DP2426 [Desulfotalea psychrophila LSv54]